MNKRFVSVIRPAMLACALLVSACAGPTLKSDKKVFNAGSILVNTTYTGGAEFEAVNGKIEFAGLGRPIGTGAAMFSVDHTTGSLAVGEKVDVDIRFTPTRPGDYSATFTPLFTTGAIDPASLPLELSGTGLAYTESMARIKGGGMPDGQDFRAKCVNTSHKWTYAITNRSAQAVELKASLVGAGAAAFTLSPQQPFTIPASGTANVEVTFAPTAPVFYSATLLMNATAQPLLLEGIWVHGRGKLC